MPYTPPAHGWRTFWLLWVSQSVSVLGSALTLFGITIWLIQSLYPRPEQKPALAFALCAVSLTFALPAVLLAPLAGAWADRYDRRRIMLLMDAASGIFSLVLAQLIFAHALSLWILLLLLLLHGLASVFHFAAFDTAYVMLIPPRQLLRANGMMQSVSALAGIIAPGIAAGIIALPALARQQVIGGSVLHWLGHLHDGLPLLILLDAVSFILSAVTLYYLSIPSPLRLDLLTEDGLRQKSIWEDIKGGAFYIWHRRPLLWLLGTYLGINFASAPAVML